jgi:4-amino-4-deoxy-L-arabinose transferase-like glycosyltransferase
LRACAAGVLAFLFLLVCTIALQWAGRAYSSEFSGFPDEPAHYVSGLMVRDYLASGLSQAPLSYAESYYFHYPEVAFGIWGPLLPVCEGVWTLLFSPSRVSVLLMMALIAATLAFTLSRVVGREFGWVAGIAAGVALVMTPCLQANTAMVMADNLCALMEFWAILFLGRYLRSERRRDILLFGLFAALAVLSKGNGIALALAPPIAVLIVRRFDLFKTLNFWLPAIMVAVLAGPWEYLSSRLLAGNGAVFHASWSAAFVYAPMYVRILGPWLLPLVLVGIYDRIVRPFGARAVEERWAAAAALIPAFWIFHAPVVGADPRYMATLVAPTVMFLVAGVARAARWLPRRAPYRARVVALAVAAACVFVGTSFAVQRKPSYGFTEVAQALTSPPGRRDSVLLISSERVGGEGMLVSEIAMRDHRPGYIVLRATKTLASTDWFGSHYQAAYSSPEEIQQYLEQVPISFLIVDKGLGRAALPHHRNLLKMLEMYPARWRLVGSYPQGIHAGAPGHGIEVYQLLGQEKRPRAKIRLDLRYTLGRWVER